MKKKNLFLATVIAVVGVSGLVFSRENTCGNQFSDLELANIEALTQNESANAVFEIIPYDCTISGNGKVKLGDGSIITISGDGSITISGARDCKLNIEAGFLCTPKMCTDLYQVIF